MSFLECGNKRLNLDNSYTMGIINLTPDSFSDGGHYNNVDAALRRAEDFINAGVEILDLGAESTRPNAKIISAQEELDRLMPVLEKIQDNFDVITSIDTSQPLVMQEALKLEVNIINDVRSFSYEGAFDVVKNDSCALCIMHMQGSPQTMQNNPSYNNVLQEVYDFLANKKQECLAYNINENRLIIDLGFGFAKNLEHNLTLIANLNYFNSLQLPMLVGVSRKRMIADVLRKEVNERLFGSLALAAISVFQGAKIIRVHDVKETVEVVKMINAVNEYKIK